MFVCKRIGSCAWMERGQVTIYVRLSARRMFGRWAVAKRTSAADVKQRTLYMCLALDAWTLRQGFQVGEVGTTLRVSLAVVHLFFFADSRPQDFAHDARICRAPGTGIGIWHWHPVAQPCPLFAWSWWYLILIASLIFRRQPAARIFMCRWFQDPPSEGVSFQGFFQDQMR